MLTFVGFGQFQVQLAFSGDTDCHISIEGDYVVMPPGGQVTTFSEAADGAAALLPLLGQSVEVAMVPTDGTARLRFESGAIAEVLDSEPH